MELRARFRTSVPSRKLSIIHGVCSSVIPRSITSGGRSLAYRIRAGFFASSGSFAAVCGGQSGGGGEAPPSSFLAVAASERSSVSSEFESFHLSTQLLLLSALSPLKCENQTSKPRKPGGRRARPSTQPLREVTDKMAAVTTAGRDSSASAPWCPQTCARLRRVFNARVCVFESGAVWKRGRRGPMSCSSSVRPADGGRKRVKGEKEEPQQMAAPLLRRCCNRRHRRRSEETGRRKRLRRQQLIRIVGVSGTSLDSGSAVDFFNLIFG